jgi:uncharacterized protein RhaS with RHS repeats
VGFKAGINFYSYVGNNPVNANDPTGMVVGKLAKEAVEYGAAKLSAAALKNLRSRAVDDAWRLEQRLFVETGETTIKAPLTASQLNELATRGKISGFEGHHINDVATNPALAGNPRNVRFEPSRPAHLDAHGGSFNNPTTGDLIDRSAGGTLPPLTLRNGREIAGYATTEFLMFGATVLGGVAAIAETLDYLDPWTYVMPTTMGVSDCPAGCGAVYGGFRSNASGGFVLYPNKANTNMLQSMYRK